MKTIQVSDEMYESLMELSKEMTSQDPMGTRMPHLFQVRTTEECAAYNGCGEQIWVNSEGDELRDGEDIVNHIKDNDDQYLQLRNYIKECSDHIIEVSNLRDDEIDKRVSNLEGDVKEIKNDVVEVKNKTNNTNAILKWLLGIFTALLIAGLIALSTDVISRMGEKKAQQTEIINEENQRMA